ncbi:MAG: TetR/AcrR family transcriptional regulator [Acidimicrobiales bacterium]
MSFRSDFEHRDALLAAAIDEFVERGYDSASINRILAEAGVSKGQLYHHFSSKEGLFLALVEWMLDQKAAWFEQHPVDAHDDLLTTIGIQIRASFAFAAAHPDIDRLSRALLEERGHPIFATVVSTFGFRPDSALGEMVDRALDQGQIRSELSPDLVRRFVLTTMTHLGDLLETGNPDALDDQIDQVLSILRHGLHGAPD